MLVPGVFCLGCVWWNHVRPIRVERKLIRGQVLLLGLRAQGLSVSQKLFGQKQVPSRVWVNHSELVIDYESSIVVVAGKQRLVCLRVLEVTEALPTRFKLILLHLV